MKVNRSQCERACPRSGTVIGMTATAALDGCTRGKSGYSWVGAETVGLRQSGGVGSLPERVLPGVASPRVALRATRDAPPS
eukprot:2005213-Pleurochrysis_carterae.AAC.1